MQRKCGICRVFPLPWKRIAQKWKQWHRNPKTNRHSSRLYDTAWPPYWEVINLCQQKSSSLQWVYILLVLMYCCDTWTVNKQLSDRIDAFNMRCQRRILRIPYTRDVTNAVPQGAPLPPSWCAWEGFNFSATWLKDHMRKTTTGSW